MTEQQAQNRLATLCAKGEHCTQEMLEKLRKWEIDDEAQARIMAYLTTHHFVDDARFCEAFIKDKIEFNGWGRRKVEQALYLKGIPRSLSDPFFEEIPDEMYLEKLRPLIQHKWPMIKGRNDYERSMKLMKYALGRGFDMRLVRLCIEEIGESLDDEPVTACERGCQTTRLCDLSASVGAHRTHGLHHLQSSSATHSLWR